MGKGNIALKKITTRAKQLQKKKPGAKWTNLIKQAGAEYRKGKLGSIGGSSRNDSSRGAGHTSTSTKAHTAGNKTATSTKTITAHVKIGGLRKNVKRQVSARSQEHGLTVGAAMHFIKKDYELKLGNAEVRLFKAATKTDKRRIRKDIAKIKKSLRKLQ